MQKQSQQSADVKTSRNLKSSLIRDSIGFGDSATTKTSREGGHYLRLDTDSDYPFNSGAEVIVNFKALKGLRKRRAKNRSQISADVSDLSQYNKN